MTVKKRGKALSNGRPPLAKHPADIKSMSSRTSRTVINTHHRLQKDHALALRNGDHEKAKELERKIEANGGIKKYQAASIQGQASDRGGDSSKVLVEWLEQHQILRSDSRNKDARDAGDLNPNRPPYRVLEIGALSTKNEISKHPQDLEVVRIDLNSQSPGIQQQDFMERPLPKRLDEFFDIISLSLVLNYVPQPVQRGEMLKRVCQFFRSQTAITKDSALLPALFFVLPLACVTNSRYMDEDLLLRIMGSLGFGMLQRKFTGKLCYYLFRWGGRPDGKGEKFAKKVIKEGPGMNNFSIVVE